MRPVGLVNPSAGTNSRRHRHENVKPSTTDVTSSLGIGRRCRRIDRQLDGIASATGYVARARSSSSTAGSSFALPRSGDDMETGPVFLIKLAKFGELAPSVRHPVSSWRRN